MNILSLLRLQSPILRKIDARDLKGHTSENGRMDQPLRSEIFTREDLAAHARQLASKHRVKTSKRAGIDLFQRFEENRILIEKCYFAFGRASNNQESIPPGAEWLLDNYHVVEEHVRDIKHHLPKSYYRTLPKLVSEDYRGYPRVYHIALEIVAHNDAVVDRDLVGSFIRAYQEISVLSIGELWAVPIMLRLALIENLRRLALSNLNVKEIRKEAEDLIDELFAIENKTGTDLQFDLAACLKERPELLDSSAVHMLRRLRGKGLKAALTQQWLEERLREQGVDPEELLRLEHQAHAANQISIGNTVIALKTVSALNWRSWFEELSQVDSILVRESSGFYAGSDFLTRDRCRHRIERLSRRSGRTETELAIKALDLAEGNENIELDHPRMVEFDDRARHVGYYLIGEGLEAFERHLNINPGLGIRLLRLLKRHAFFVYSATILFFSFCILALLLKSVVPWSSPMWVLAAFLVFAFLPANHLASDLVQWLVTNLVRPTRLPKLDFDEGISEDCRTLVTVHSIFSERESITRAIEQLEVRFLANEDKQIFFALLADLYDSDHETNREDQDLVDHAESMIDELNQRYGQGQTRFFLLFRKRLWNPSEKKYMGWERKRGKVMELNRLILGASDTSFIFNRVDLEVLRTIRYVITLDSDSQLPRGTARRLVGTIAHPLNRPLFHKTKNTVVYGYGVIQPRVGVSLTSANVSNFSRIFSTNAGLDPYTNTVSDVYQDLFAEGSYIGKGIYDVRAFERSLSGRVPENALLSHDLFEGLFARVALATDIELLDEFPSRLNVHSKRQHRWVRGDWQLLPWMFRRIPDANRQSYPSPISSLGIWKLVDNLKRSLLAPSVFVFLLMSWTIFPGNPWIWSLFILLVLAFPLYSNLANALMVPPLGLVISVYVRGIGRDLFKHTQQTLVSVSILPFHAYMMVHAILITLWRTYISKTHLLEWETAHTSERRLKNNFRSFYQLFFPAIILAIFAFVCVLAFRPISLIHASPFLILWLFSPYLAWQISRIRLQEPSDLLGLTDKEYLTDVAHSTWLFFETLMDEKNNYLVPDNIQLVPRRVVAERTSPTNIGLAMLSVLSAYDLGFLNLGGCVNRISRTVTSLRKLERFHGHFYNWYQTVTLQPLSPRYISTVDSGNFVACMIALETVAKTAPHMPLFSEKHRQHLQQLLSKRSVKLITSSEGVGIETLRQILLEIGKVAEQREDLRGIPEISDFLELRYLTDWFAPLTELFEVFKIKAGNASAHVGETERQLRSVHRILQNRTPTLSLIGKILNRIETVTKRLKQSHEVPSVSQVDLDTLLESLAKHVEIGQKRLTQYSNAISNIQTFCEETVKNTDFAFLYDSEKNLFTIGFNADDGRRDSSYYDLLASEARIASLIAIARGMVPQKHWFALARTLTNSSGGRALLSWSGTMFEYLMPILLSKNYRGTILSETYTAVVKAQEIYGKRRGVPWGVSESGYSGVDFEKTYQYHAFGVPGLGLKRGLSEDLVISPYSSFLALLIDPKSSIKNIYALDKDGLRGEFGFYEAADYTKDRLSVGEDKHIVCSFLAHHQGMIMTAIDNFLNDGILQERFHADPAIKSCELLLHERFPQRVPAIQPHQAELSYLDEGDQKHIAVGEIITTPHTVVPRIRLLSNGRYSVIVDNAGSGHSFFDRDISITRWREDSLNDNFGFYIYVRDLETGRLWSVAYQPTRVEPETYEVIFNPDKIEFKRRDFGISLHTEITVSPEDNVEIRRVVVRNLSNKHRSLELTSYGEVALARSKADAAHPAFSKMFIESEYNREFDALIFSRRPRSVHEDKLYCLHMLSMRVVWSKTKYETMRPNFIGRGESVHRPAALDDKGLLGTVGPVLDPVFSLQTRLEIAPGAAEEASFITAISNNKEEVFKLAKRYHEIQSVTRAFEMSWSQSNVELRHEQISIAQAHVFQKLANAIVFNVDRLRGEAEVIAKNRLTQSGLWRFGISGDLPICLVRVSDPAHLKTVQELLLAHWYLRGKGLSFDLVILNEYPGGYLQHLQNELEALARHGYSASLVDKNGGVFLRTVAQLSEPEVALLVAIARVVILGAAGPLSAQLSYGNEEYETISRKRAPFSFVNKERFSAFEPPTHNLEYMNGVGGFSDEGASYTLALKNKLLPPMPWCNVIANSHFGCIVSESGGGYTWSDNSRENRLTPWFNDPVSDPIGEALYLRNVEDGTYWSLTPRPAPSGESFTVKHGFGFSEFHTQVNGVFSSLTIYVSPDEKIKWWKIKLVNGDYRPRHLEAVLYLEWVVGILRDDSFRHLVTDFDVGSQALFATNYYNNEFAGRHVVVGSNLNVQSYTTSRQEFLGRNRDASCPHALENGALSSLATLLSPGGPSLRLQSKVGAGFDSCAALCVNLSLEPHSEEEFVFYLGEAPSTEARKKLSQRARSVLHANEALLQAKQRWAETFNAVKVKTPERSFDIMLNGWLPYQTLVCRMNARSALYQSGGALGFRDQLQDAVSLGSLNPGLLRSQILLHASRQFVEGDVQHWWHPPTGRGVRTRISDDYLWLPYAVCRYIEITGEPGILDEEVSFIEGPALDDAQMEAYIVPHVSPQQGTLYEHCVIALDRALKFGPHGLPLIGGGDWNDGMNEVGMAGKGESVWLGWFLGDVLSQFVPFVKNRRDNYRASEYLRAIQNIKNSIETHAWDGNWYLRAFFDDGSPLGSAKNAECQIDSLSQSWAVISKLGDSERAKTAMNEVLKRLVREKDKVICLLSPPFDGRGPTPGYIAGYLPGIRENGAQYTHAATWVIMAVAMLRQGDLAMKLFNMINPINHTSSYEAAYRYQGEPYVTCGDVYSEKELAGKAGWSWYTGSCGWLYRLGLEYILGIRILDGRIEIDPCVPKNWDKFSVSLKVRDRNLEIEVENPEGLESGVKSLVVNGQKLDQNVIPISICPVGATTKVSVLMGQ